jgi:hypothetical protein
MNDNVMRILPIWALVAIPALAQTPTVRLTNTTHPGSPEFQIGDRFEIVITAAPNQPVSVRTTTNGLTDWGPVAGSTGPRGQWSATGQFAQSDYGDWSELWTVGGKLATSVIHFSVTAPCLKGGYRFVETLGRITSETCDTAEGRRTFTTPSAKEPFRTADRHQADVMEFLIAAGPEGRRVRPLGDQAAALITRIIGANALTESETRNVLSIVHAAFEKPDRIPPAAKNPSATVPLLQNLANAAADNSLQQQIAGTIAYVTGLHP